MLTCQPNLAKAICGTSLNIVYNNNDNFIKTQSLSSWLANRRYYKSNYCPTQIMKSKFPNEGGKPEYLTSQQTKQKMTLSPSYFQPNFFLTFTVTLSPLNLNNKYVKDQWDSVWNRTPKKSCLQHN